MSLCAHGQVAAYCPTCASEFLSTSAYHDEVDRRARSSSQGPHGRSFVVEIITDPADPRGLDAKPIRRAA